VIPQQPAADAEPMPDGLVEAMDQELAPEPGETPALPPSEQAEKARIAQFETEQKFPQHTKEIIDEIDELRTFVNKTVMEPKVVGGVAENLILRNQYIRMGQTWAKNPDLTCQPRKLLGPPKKFKVPPPPEALMANPELQQQVEQDMLAQQDFEAYVEALSMFGQTIEILVKKGFDDAGGAQVLEGGIQDVQTDGFWWVKATWQESMGRDPIGVHRANDFQDTVARLESLAHSYEQGEFDDQDPRYSEYLDLSDTVREQVMAEEWVGKAYGEVATGETDENGQPVMEPQDPRELAWQTGERAPCSAIAEIPRLRTWRIDPIDPRDVRRDWSITRPEEWRKCRWISHRLWMTDADLMDEFGVTKEGLADCAASTPAQTLGDPRAPGAQAQPMTTEDPADRSDVEQPARNGQRAVWERWDRSANRRYVWIEGGSKFLVNEVPIVVSKGWYPFFLLWFNRVTGRFEPISDAKLQRPLNEEYNLLRTHDRQARRAAYNKYIIAKNLLSEEEKAKLESCPPEGVIECKRANEVRKYLQVVVGSNYQPLLYDTTKVRQALDETSNTPSSARGNTATTKFATSDMIANAVMNEQSDRYRGRIEWFCQELFAHMADIIVQVMPEANAKALAGPGAVWPMMDRETLWTSLSLTIEAGSTGKPDQQRKLGLYESMAGILNSLGVGAPGGRYGINALTVMKDLLDTMGIRVEPERYIEELPPMLPAPAGGPPSAPPGGPSPDPSEEDGGGGDGNDGVPAPPPPPGAGQQAA
jgi:hypothetical protein